MPTKAKKTSPKSVESKPVSVSEKPPAGLAAKLKQNAARSENVAPHLIVEARAGTGKTTTLVEGLKRVKGIPSSLVPSPQQAAVWESMELSRDARTVCFVAFNKSIADELARRVPAGCDAMTMHSMGFRAVQSAFGRVNVADNSWRCKEIIAELLGKDIRELMKHDPTLVFSTVSLVEKCKMNLSATDEESLDQLASHYDIELNGSRSAVFSLVPRVIERSKDVQRDKRIDFIDMIWLPVACNLPLPSYDLLLVDEAQDLNRCQQAIAKRVGKRLVLCGDPKQAIYGFAGADAESMPRMARELGETERGCVTLPLTVTRRCGKAIVAEAKKIVPDFDAFETNPEGKVSRAEFRKEDDKQTPPRNNCDYRSDVQNGDFILCRVNAPLVSECFRFLRQGRKANIQGRDVGQGLIGTIKKLIGKDAEHNESAESVVDLVSKLNDWLAAETAKENAKRNPSESRLIALQDRYDCLMCFTEDQKSSAGVIRKIEAIFTDKSTDGIKLSSVHKAKGHESDRVFFLMPEGAECPHPMAKSAWQKEQEWNIYYVAVTRARNELVFVR